MLVPEDHEKALFPERRIAEGFVDLFDEALAAGHAIHRVLRRAAFEGAGDIAVVGLDEGEGDIVGGGGRVYVVGEFRIVMHVLEGDALHGLRHVEGAAAIDARAEGLLEDGAVFEGHAVDRELLEHFEVGRAVVEAARGAGEEEETVGQRGPGHGREPRVADGELAGEGVEDGEFLGREAPHDFAGVGAGGGASRRHETRGKAGAGPRRIGAALREGRAGAAQLLHHVGKLVARVGVERTDGGGRDPVVAAGVGTRLLAGQTVEPGGRAGLGVGAGDAGTAEQVVKGTVLKHEHEDVLDGGLGHGGGLGG